MIKASTAALPGSRGLAIISPGRRAPARPSLGFGEKNLDLSFQGLGLAQDAMVKPAHARGFGF